MKTLCLLVCIAFAMNSYGQKISLKENNEPLPKVLHDLEKQTGYQFFFSDNTMKASKKISLDVKNEDVKDVLVLCFKDQPLTYSMSGNAVMIKPKDEDLKKNESLNNIVNHISGHVTDSAGAPLVGASVLVKGTANGTTTNSNGDFILNGVEENAVLLFSYTGYATKQIRPKSGEAINISLVKSVSSLDEIQIIAYGNTTQRLNTGDVTTVKAAEIEMQPVSNPILALEGRVPGMYILQTNGLPGSASAVQVQIRGTNSIQHSGDPLYIIDGVPYVSEMLNTGGDGVISQGNPFNFLNPGDIEAIDILKDADATAIYGSRGANGVILITTKKGKEGSTRFEVNMQSGLGSVAHEMKMLNTRQYLDMRYEAFKNDGATPDPNVDYDLTQWDTTRETDWQKTLIGGTAQYNDIQASLSGGNSTTQFIIGAGYHKETTVFPGDWNDQKGSVHFSINNSSFQKKIKVFLSGSFILDNNDLGQFDLTQWATLLPPDAPPLLNSDGTVNWAPNAQGVTTWPLGESPMATFASKFNVNTSNLVSSAGVSYDFLPGLQVKTTMGFTNMQNNGFSSDPFAASDPSTWTYRLRTSRFSDNHIQSWIIEPQASYQKNISKGSLTALLGSTIEQNTTTGQIYQAAGFNSDLLMTNILAATSITAVSNTSTLYKYNAVFGRLNYNWQDEYIINLVIRRDGSSRFGPANRFANFYSVSGGWIFSKESLSQKMLPFLSYGKLRSSYGTTGNDQIGDYTYLDLYNSLSGIGIPYQGANGIRPVSIYTPNLQWELTRKFEIGLELGFLKDRLLITSSYYLNRSTNQLVAAPLPSITGFTTIQENLPALVQNTGLEFQIKTINFQHNTFRWTSSFNYTQNRNILVRISPGMGEYYMKKLGHSLNSGFFYHFAGVNPITGINQFTDSKGLLVPNPNAATDMTVSENRDPKFFGGFQNSLGYKHFQLDFLFQFVKQWNVGFPYNSIPGNENINQPITVLSRWRQPGDVSNIERFSQNESLKNSNTYAYQSDQMYQDASFIRLKNLSLSYLVPSKMTEKWHLQSAQIFVHGQNLLTLTKYEGLDPESLSYNSLPPLRVVTFGIQVVF